MKPQESLGRLSNSSRISLIEDENIQVPPNDPMPSVFDNEDAEDENSQQLLPKNVDAYTFVSVHINRPHPDLTPFIQNEDITDKDLLEKYLTTKMPDALFHVGDVSLSIYNKEPMNALLSCTIVKENKSRKLATISWVNLSRVKMSEAMLRGAELI
ncbi:hypothetical protein L228DRAFT_240343 [Xylona heveae TC161]|uniref:Uncharacterized protein n=1 Tax=Xylona heveae (strain CBS 132557 / TC161) TaxID=1328760 RepID=A0A165AJ35_XYLHT|nr:hypothetical protein L228DRAFT_240343 [Xylona heveae TC161]KZF20561.1 hypothetical protein L228DRAFT_240343 [Xylona heveae TC161]